MERNQNYIDLEAYLDGELDSGKIEVFEAALESDPELKTELEVRRLDRNIFRSALGEDVSIDRFNLSEKSTMVMHESKTSGRKLPVYRIGIAMAASICLIFLVPQMLRDNNGAEGPRSIITMSGQVTVSRYGEIPGETAMIGTGALELPAGLSR